MATTYTPRTIPSSSYKSRTDISNILREDGFYLLREDGSRFLREESYVIFSEWTPRTII